MKLFFRLAICLLAMGLLTGCSSHSKEPITKSDYYFDTIITITLYDSKNSNLLDECFAYCKDFENLISRTISGSDIDRINASGGKPVEVSDITIDLIKKGMEYGELTNGKFDITIAPLSILWNVKENPGEIPSEAAISESLSYVNYKNIVIDGNTVALKDNNARIDLGGIAKGYVADHLKEYLLENGVKSALINLGGNVLTIGSKPNGTPFQIGIQKPFDEQNKAITSVSATNTSVVTSGSYERFFEKNGHIYHHIIDPSTGFPCENDLLSVTILSNDSITGDALSTSCFLLGLNDGIKLIESFENVGAIFITSDYKVIDTRK